MSEAYGDGSGVIDVAALAAAGESRIRWSHLGDDLAVNVVALEAGEEIPIHVNAEVEVLMVAVAGAGTVALGQDETPIRAGQLLVIAKGVPRGMRAGSERFVYITCHRRREALRPTLRPSPANGG